LLAVGDVNALVPMTRWSPELIRHRDWENAVGARLLHFPYSSREHMQRFRKVVTGRQEAASHA
jgi:hypothetical protein